MWKCSLLDLALNYLNVYVVLCPWAPKNLDSTIRDFHNGIFISFYIPLYIVNYIGVDTKAAKTILIVIHFIGRYIQIKDVLCNFISLVLNISFP